MNRLPLILDTIFITSYNIAIICMLIKPNIKTLKKIIPFLVSLAISLASIIFIINIFSYKQFVIFAPLIIQLPIFLAFNLISTYKGLKLLFVILTSFVWNMPLMLLVNLFAPFFNYNPTLKLLLHLFFIPIFLYLIFLYFQPIYKYILIYLENGWLFLCLIPLVCLILIYTENLFAIQFDIYTFKKTQIWRHIISSLVFLIYILVMFSLKQIKSQLEVSNELKLFKYQLSGASSHIQNLKNSISQTKIYQHDFRHHMQLISAMASKANNIEIIDYINTVQTNIARSAPYIFCLNETINLIISSFYTKAQDLEINLIVSCSIPSKLNLSDEDLCVLLSNALENAIKATSIVFNKKKEIKLSLVFKNEKIFLEISNPYLGNILFNNSLPISNSKTGGIGTKSIAYIVNKYDGIYQFSTESEYFILQIII